MTDADLDHDAALSQLGQLLDRNRLAQARALLSQALPKYPDSPPLLQYSAWIDWMEDRLDAAEATAKRVLEMDPESFGSRFLLSKIFTETGRLPEAERALIDLISDYPEDARLYADYAKLMLSAFELEKAERLAGEALRLEPQNESALNVSVLSAFVNHPGPETEQRLQALLEEHPDQFGTAIRLVQYLIDKGRHEEAYELSRQLVQQQPDNDDLVELATDLRHATHWSLKPLWPMRRFGWGGSLGLYVIIVGLFGSGLLQGTALEPMLLPIGVLFLIYVVYSWVWPPLLRRLLR